jgi:DNA replication ATP-dependent helicase Dna2
LIVKLAKSGGKRVVHLRECWADLPIQTSKQSPSNEVQADFDLEDTINIVSPSLDDADTTKPIIVTFKDPSTFLIHHPDLMLTMTSIANAMPCPRKPLLQALVKPSGPSTKSMLYGTILHTLLQGALSEQGFAEADTWRRLDEDLSKEERKLEIWGAGLDIDDVRLELGEKAEKGFEVFGDKWVGPAPKAGHGNF